jgi:aspartyl-tRNA(Asn)/glutamyl-tRNA(Gln) amidotransferase subunit A
MTILTNLTIAEALLGLKKKEFSSVELTEAHLKQMAATKPLNAYITETPEHARTLAAAADARYQRGEALPLDGIPVGVKDLFSTVGVKTTAGACMLENYTPIFESTVSAKFAAAGTVMLGKTNMDEFAMGSSNITSHFGSVINPWKANGDTRDLVPGGSSGGSAAAVAAGSAMATLGSDTGGSVRQPAVFCGIVGIKPTYGRCSRYGMVAFASSLDQAGLFTRTVADSALTLQSIMGHDPKDSTCANQPVPDLTAMLTKGVKGMRIGIPKEYRHSSTDPEIIALWEKAAKWLSEQGAEIVDVSLPHTDYALATYYIIAPAEASSNLARYDGVRFGHRAPDEGVSLDEFYSITRAEGFGKEVKRRIMIGTYVLSSGYYDAYYRKAQCVRTLICNDFHQAFERVDALLTPATPSAAFALGEKMDDPVQMYLNDLFTIPASIAGLPAMALPLALSAKGLPIGLQLITKQYDEAGLFQVASALEIAAGFSTIPRV